MIYVFEPHGDDALLSCWPLLNNSVKAPVTVVTLGHSRSSSGLMKYLPQVTSTLYLDLPELDWKFRGSYAAGAREHRKTAGKDTLFDWQIKATESRNPGDFERAFLALLQCLPKLVSAIHVDDIVVLPVGLVHPYHVLVSHLFQHLLSTTNFLKARVWYYSDCPYNCGKWTLDVELSHPALLQRSTFEFDVLAQAEFKKQVFLSVYPTESNLLRFFHQVAIDTMYRLYPDAIHMQDITSRDDWTGQGALETQIRPCPVDFCGHHCPMLPVGSEVLRGSGQCICALCGRELYQHPHFAYPTGMSHCVQSCDQKFYHL